MMLKRNLLIASLALIPAFGVVLAGGGHPSHRGRARYMAGPQERVESLAYRIETATMDTILATRRGRFLVRRDEARLLDRLYELDREAKQFRRLAVRHGYSPRRIERAFLELERAYFKTARRIDACRHCRRGTLRHFRDVGRLMTKLRGAVYIVTDNAYRFDRSYRPRDAYPVVRHYPRRHLEFDD